MTPRGRGRRARRGAGVIASLCASVTLLAGCVTNSEVLVPEGEPPAVSTDDALAALVPEPIAARGTLVVGANPPYAPNEFKDDDGAIVGYAVELVTATAQVLGLRAEFKEADFDRIIPAVQTGTFDAGSSSFTDTREREKTVDFVTYYRAGISWARQVGSDVDPDDACGLRVAVQTTTVSDTDDVPSRSDACVAAGRPPIRKYQYDSQDEATTALVLGRVDALSADSPVTAYAIERTKGKLEQAGSVFDSAPYGWVVAKGSPLGPALQQALQRLIDDGTYLEIAGRWGMEDGVIDRSVINGAES